MKRKTNEDNNSAVKKRAMPAGKNTNNPADKRQGVIKVMANKKQSKTQKSKQRDARARASKAKRITSTWSDSEEEVEDNDTSKPVQKEVLPKAEETEIPVDNASPINSEDDNAANIDAVEAEGDEIWQEDMAFSESEEEDDSEEEHEPNPKKTASLRKKNQKDLVNIKTEMTDNSDEEEETEDEDENLDKDDEDDDDEYESDEMLEETDEINADGSNPNEESKQRKMANAISKLLGQELGKEEKARPILSGRKSIERKLDNSKLDEKARKVISSQKKKKASDGRVMPDITKLDYEKKLRKIATRGVVQLFNAIRIAQKATAPKEEKIIAPTALAEQGRLSKDVFLQVLKGGEIQKQENPKPAPKSEEKVSWLKSDYMTAPSNSHWDEKEDDL